jgi:hypothetical protein
MSATRSKKYERKRTRQRVPHGSDLGRVIKILEFVSRHGRLPRIQLYGPDDDPLGEHIAKLKRVLIARESAEEVFGQRPGSGRPSKADSHRELAEAYYRARGIEAPYRMTSAEACDKVRAQRAKWATLVNDTIRRYAREQRDDLVLFEDLDAGTEKPA